MYRITFHGLWLFQAGVQCISLYHFMDCGCFSRRYTVYRYNISWTLVVSGGGTGCFVIAFRGLWMFQAEVHCVS